MKSNDQTEHVLRLAFTPLEAARSVKVSERTLRLWMREYGLPYFQCRGTVRIPVAEFKEWICERMIDEKRGEAIANQILTEL